MALLNREEPREMENVRPTRLFNHASRVTTVGDGLIQDNPNIDLQDQLLTNTSGYHIEKNGASSQSYYTAEQAEEEKDRDRLALFKESFAGGSIKFEGITLTVDTFVDKMTKSVAADQAWKNLGSQFVEVKEDQILRDKDGQIVKTLEEKRKMEDEKGVCLANYSQDELTRDPNGKLVLGSAFLAQSTLEEQIREKEKVVADVQSGKVKLEDVPDQFKKDAADRVREDQTPKAKTLADGPVLEPGLNSLEPAKPAPEPTLSMTLQTPKFGIAAPSPSGF